MDTWTDRTKHLLHSQRLYSIFNEVPLTLMLRQKYYSVHNERRLQYLNVHSVLMLKTVNIFREVSMVAN